MYIRAYKPLTEVHLSFYVSLYAWDSVRYNYLSLSLYTYVPATLPGLERSDSEIMPVSVFHTCKSREWIFSFVFKKKIEIKKNMCLCYEC